MRALVLILLFAAGQLPACTAFLLRSGHRVLAGKNYDWQIEDGMVIENPRGLSKTAFRVRNPASWTSKYGSITFCQYGREFPQSGINEKGLVIEVLWLDAAQYLPPDQNPEIDNVQWVQYQLDRSASVDEVVAALDAVRIRPSSPSRVHYFVADGAGDAAVIEFVEGQRRVYLGESLPAPVLTNNTYAESERALRMSVAFGGTLPVPDGQESISRFVRTGAQLKADTAHADPVDHAFSILESVTVPLQTKWSIVYDITGLSVHYRSRSSRKTKSLHLPRFDFDCHRPVSVALIYAAIRPEAGEGDLNEQQYRTIVRTAFRKTTFLRYLGEDFLSGILSYPGSFVCE